MVIQRAEPVQIREAGRGGVLDVEVSAFRDVKASAQNVNLLTWLTSAKFVSQLVEVRKFEYGSDPYNRAKLSLPGITPCGVFSERKSEGLQSHSGLIALDVDAKDNPHVRNFDDLPRLLSGVKEIAYIGRSVSGLGFWILVCIHPPASPQEHGEYYEALRLIFLNQFKLVVDKACKDVSRFRFYAFDEEAHFNHNAKRLKLPPRRKAEPVRVKRPVTADDTTDRFYRYVEEIERRRATLADDYSEWFKVGQSIANQFGEAGRSAFHSISQFSAKYRPSEVDKHYSAWLKNRTSALTIGTFFYYCDLNGIRPDRSDARLTSIRPGTQAVRQKPDYPLSWDNLVGPPPRLVPSPRRDTYSDFFPGWDDLPLYTLYR